MGKRTRRFFVEGMTCSSCEARIERALLAIPGVASARADRGRGAVVLEYEEARASPEAAAIEAEAAAREAVAAAIAKAGYRLRGRRDAGTLIALGVGLVLAAAYMAAGSAGLFSALPSIDASIGYGMLFVAGLLTSVHCVAMCGGISLSQSLGAAPSAPVDAARGARESRDAPRPRGELDRFLPGLLYNGGRIVSYTIIGGIVGAIGSVFDFSPAVKAAIAGAAGLFMLYLGVRMLGLLPALPGFSRAPRGAIAKRLGAARSPAARYPAARIGSAARGPFAVGLLNGLMPCGPLQTMQLYALGTGSFLAGALSMFAFSIGTAPLMLVFGLAATLLPRRFSPVMVKASAVLVMFLGVVTFSRAASLAGIAAPTVGLPVVASVSSGGAPEESDGPARAATAAPESASGAAPGAGSAAAFAAAGAATVSDTKGPGIVATLENGVQKVTTEFKDGLYVPFTVQAGVPVQWTIRVTRAELNGCNNPVTIPAYRIKKKLVPGDNLVEFTPRQSGTIVYTCWMGMISSRISVVPDLSAKSGTENSYGGAGGFVVAVGGPGAPAGPAEIVGPGLGAKGVAAGAACGCSR